MRMHVKGASQSSLADALDNAIREAAPTNDIPRTYDVRRAWVEVGGIVGQMYYVEVDVTGPDVRP
jgi:flavin-binding protein dodecin